MREPTPTAARYVYAALCVAVALVAAMALASFDLEGFVFVLAVAVAVWVGGRGPGLLAVALSVLALHFVFISPMYAGAMPHTVGYFVLFSLLALLITSLAEGRHRAERSLVTARDELEAKVAERTEDLQRKQDLLELAQRSARAMAFDWYFDREVNVWSPDQEMLYGLRPGTFDGRYASWKKLIHPADWPLVTAAMLRARDDGEIATEFRVIWPDGSIHWLSATGLLFLDAGGKPYRMVGFTADVTARKLGDEQRRRYEAYLSAGEGVSHTGSWAVEGTTKKVLHSSDEHRRLFGFDPQAGVPSREAYFERVHPDDRSVCAEAIGTVADRKVRREWQYRVTLPDCTSKHFAAVAHPVLDAGGNVVEIIGTTMDVTERKRAEEALRDSEHRLREAQAELAHVTRVTTLGEVTASLAHELNQPLAAIMNNASACLAVLSTERPDVEEVRAGLQDIVDDTERARVIMERVRGLAKRSATETGPIALADVVADVIALAATESAARSVTIRADVAPDVPVVIGDRVQLQQVLLNLVVNGMDAMSTAPDAARSLEIRVQRDQHGGVPSARVAVCDRGIGLDSVEPDRLFEAFYTTKPQGMGMGLAISRSIIEAHGGRLWAEANDGSGATFSFSIPVAS